MWRKRILPLGDTSIRRGTRRNERNGDMGRIKENQEGNERQRKKRKKEQHKRATEKRKKLKQENKRWTRVKKIGLKIIPN